MRNWWRWKDNFVIFPSICRCRPSSTGPVRYGLCKVTTKNTTLLVCGGL
ncbi:hypothetical protein LINPERHAP1_LOCUS9286, partial [Linum perenne]